MSTKINNYVEDIYCDYANSMALKAKGFDVPSLTFYPNQSEGVSRLSVPHTQHHLGEFCEIISVFSGDETNIDKINDVCLAPTISVACKWLESNFGGWFIEVNKVYPNIKPDEWRFNFNYYYSFVIYDSEESRIKAYMKMLENPVPTSKDEAYKKMSEHGAYTTEYNAYNIAIKSILEKI